MTLGPQHVETAELDDLVVLGPAGLLGGGQGLRPGLLVLLGVLLRIQAGLLEGGDRDVLGVAAQHDVGSASGHVGGHGDGALAPGHGHDGGLAGVLLGVEDLVGDALLAQALGEDLRLLHAGGAHQDRLAELVALGDIVDDGVELGLDGGVDEVGLVLTDHGLVGGDRDDADLVGAGELGGLGLGGTGHARARALGVEAEVVLEGDGGQGLVLGLDLHALLGLDGLVHALVVAAAGQDTAGVLVDDEDLAVAHDVVLVPVEELLGLDGVVKEADQGGVLRLVEVVHPEVVLHPLNAGGEHTHGALLLVDLVVLARAQALGDRGELLVPLVDVAAGRTGDDERGTGFVDEDGVDLVDDDEGVAALDQVLGALGHVVAQIVEAELVVGAVGDVAGVLLTALGGRLSHEDAAGGQPQEAVDAPHEVGLVLGEVVVDGHDVNALAGQGPQVGGHRGHEGLALTGLHLGDVAAVEGRPAHDLDVVGAHAQDAVGRLHDRGEGLGQQVVEGLPVLVALLELISHLAQLGVGELAVLVGESLHLVGDGIKLLQGAALANAKDPVHDRHAAFSLGTSDCEERR